LFLLAEIMSKRGAGSGKKREELKNEELSRFNERREIQ